MINISSHHKSHFISKPSLYDDLNSTHSPIVVHFSAAHLSLQIIFLVSLHINLYIILHTLMSEGIYLASLLEI